MKTLSNIKLLKERCSALDEESTKIYQEKFRQEQDIQTLQIQYIFDNKLLSGEWLLEWRGTLATSELSDKFFDDLPKLVDLVVEYGEHEHFRIPWGNENEFGNVSVGFDDGEIRISFGGLTDNEIFDFFEKAGIVIKLDVIDRRIVDAEQGLKSLLQIKDMFK